MSNQIETLPKLLNRAARLLEGAQDAAALLEARAAADLAYSAAKTVARLSKIKNAHDQVQATARKVMGDSIRIETRCQCRLADEIDLAQAQGQLRTQGDNAPGGKAKNAKPQKAGLKDIGITGNDVYQARIIRDAIAVQPEFVSEIIEEKLRNAQQPTRRHVQQAARAISRPAAGKQRRRKVSNGRAEATLSPAAAAVAAGDVERARNLIERVRTRYSTGHSDVIGLCIIAEKWVAEHIHQIPRDTSRASQIDGAQAAAAPA